MKFAKKMMALLVVVLLMTAFAPAALASTSNCTVEAGDTVTVTFKYSNIYNVDGFFQVDDPKGIVADYDIKVLDAGSAFATTEGDGVWVQPAGDPKATTVRLGVVLEINDDAAAGSTCTVSFDGIYGDADKEPGNEQDISESATVTVKKAESSSDDDDDKEDQKDKDDEVKIDYTELERQITIADGLVESDYTDASWEALEQALAAAKDARDSKSQAEVDAAAQALADAIAALVKIDRSALEQALANVDQYVSEEEIADLFLKLADAVARGRELLNSGDQEAIDATAAEIESLLQQIKDAMAAKVTTETVEVEKEVEVMPEGEFCSIPMHRVWPILFFISLILNIVLVVVLVGSIKKKRNQDNTPLVDYEIGDDN